MAQSSNTVKFVYIPAGGSLPSQRDGNTIYFCVDDKKLYVGADLIADSVDVSVTGAGNYISDAVFSDGTLTLTKSTLPDVSGAMRFIGISSTEITDQGVETPTIDGEPVTPESGDVVLYEGLEFVWDGSKWNQLGDESSYALKTLTVTAGNGLTGGGTLASDLTLTHYTPVSATTSYGGDSSLIKQIRVDDFGHIVEAIESNIEDAISSYIYSFASVSYVDDAVSGLISSGDVPGIIGSMGLVDSQYVSNAISDLVSSGYVSDVVSTAIADLASIEYVTGAITSATSTLTSKTYVDNAISGLASEGYVDDSVSGLASEGYVDDAISSNIPNQSCDYLAWVESAGTHYYTYGSFGSIGLNSNDPVTGATVYEAISEFASEGYVDDAISNAGFATESYVDEAISSAIPESFVLEVDTPAPPLGQYLYAVEPSSNPLALTALHHDFGSIASGDGALVTGGIVYSAMRSALSQYYSHADFNINVSAGDDYVRSVFFDHSDVLQFMLDDFASSITSNGSTPVTGSTVYSAISNLVSADYVSSAIASATSSLASEGYVDNAVSDLLSSGNLSFVSRDSENLQFVSYVHVDDVTGSLEFAFSNFSDMQLVSLDQFAAYSGSNTNGTYLYSMSTNSETGNVQFLYSTFGSIASDSLDPVTGSTLYSDVLLLEHYRIQETTDSDIQSYLYAIDSGSDHNGLYVKYAPFGSVASGNNYLVKGGAVYSAIQSAVPTWTVI